MNLRPYLPLLLGAFLLPASVESAHANPFSATSSSSQLIAPRTDLALRSDAFVVANPRTGEILAERNANRVMSIAALVVLDANLRLNETLTVTMDDVDRLKGTGSRLAVGSRLSRADMLHIALMSSENRAASALGRYYPGGRKAFIEAMNAKARMLGMWSTHFADSTGLNPRNVSTAHDLAKLAAAASTYPLIRQYTASEQRLVRNGKRQLWCATANARCSTTTPTAWCGKGAGPSWSPRPVTSARQAAAW